MMVLHILSLSCRLGNLSGNGSLHAAWTWVRLLSYKTATNRARFGQGAHGSGPRRRPALRQPPAKACSFASRAHGSGPPAWICMATASGRESAAELPALCCTPGASSLALSQVVGILSLQLGKVILLVRHFFVYEQAKR